MTGYSVAGCSNHSRNGFKIIRFPANKERRQKWAEKCKSKDWEPKENHRICSVHFDESQFEEFNGKTRLKLDALPTIFKSTDQTPSVLVIVNNPEILTAVEETEKPMPNVLVNGSENKENVDLYESVELRKKIDALQKENRALKQEAEDMRKRIEDLEAENRDFKKEAEERNKILSSFLSEEQIKALYYKRLSIKSWSEEAIIKGLKIRFAVGKNGYDYLRSMNYPTPSYSTLNRRIAHLSPSENYVFIISIMSN